MPPPHGTVLGAHVPQLRAGACVTGSDTTLQLSPSAQLGFDVADVALSYVVRGFAFVERLPLLLDCELRPVPLGAPQAPAHG